MKNWLQRLRWSIEPPVEEGACGFDRDTLLRLVHMDPSWANDAEVSGERERYLRFEAAKAVMHRSGDRPCQFPCADTSELPTGIWLPTPDLSCMTSEACIQMMLDTGAAVFPSAFPTTVCEQLEAIVKQEVGLKINARLTGAILARSRVKAAIIPPDIDNIVCLVLHALHQTLLGYLGSTALPDGFDPTMFGAQEYPLGYLGLMRHRDYPQDRNLVGTLSLSEHADFTVVSPTGKETTWSLGPGALVLMPGPGFCGLNLNPEHWVGPMLSGRMVLSLRQRDQALLKR